MKFLVLTEVSIKITVYWDMMLAVWYVSTNACSLLKIEVVGSTKTLMCIYQIWWQHILEVHNLVLNIVSQYYWDLLAQGTYFKLEEYVRLWRILFSLMWLQVIWWIITNISEEPTASTFRIGEKVIGRKVAWMWGMGVRTGSASKQIGIRKAVLKNVGYLKDHSPRTEWLGKIMIFRESIGGKREVKKKRTRKQCTSCWFTQTHCFFQSLYPCEVALRRANIFS